jgi:lipopolysaccharide/colanic/teichoic acid biosynthesis glycosyltransferase
VAASICAPVQPSRVSNWSLSHGKRWMDVIAALVGLLFLSPLMCVIALIILITSGKPILFRQWRIGRNGRQFRLLKFRTMRVSPRGDGPGLTQSGDARITPIGLCLRRWKLDELPQLFNVLNGEMTLVGPRPDLEEFWLEATAADRSVLVLTPGLTGAASLTFSDEECLLAQVPQERLTQYYLEQVLPDKARLDMEYAERATFRSDCSILVRTLLVPFCQRRDEKGTR